MPIDDITFLKWPQFLAQLCVWPSFESSGSSFLSLYHHLAAETERRGGVGNRNLACL